MPSGLRTSLEPIRSLSPYICVPGQRKALIWDLDLLRFWRERRDPGSRAGPSDADD
jgi:hypothetical protein